MMDSNLKLRYCLKPVGMFFRLLFQPLLSVAKQLPRPRRWEGGGDLVTPPRFSVVIFDHETRTLWTENGWAPRWVFASTGQIIHPIG